MKIGKAIHAVAPTPLIFKLQKKVLESNNIYVHWSLPKNDLGTNFLKVKNQTFINFGFSQ